MTNKKLLLLIPIIFTISLTLGLYQYQSTTANNSTELHSSFREDIRELVFSSNGDYTWEEAVAIMHLHEDELREIILVLELEDNQRMPEKDKQGLLDYMLHEELKHQNRLLTKTMYLDSTEEQVLESNDPELFGQFFQSVYARSSNNNSCDIQSKIILFRQSKIDIDGGTLNDYKFEGDNKLISVDRNTLKNCSVEYTLTFKDEDHPKWDSKYDSVRGDHYGRIQDIETFIVKQNDKVQYDDIWSDDKSYDYLLFGIFGQHAYHTGDFDRVMYVANTWNHAMDTENTNPDLRQKLFRFR